jgi:hypothetical protein
VAHGHDCAAVRGQRDVADAAALGASGRRGQLDPPEDLTEHDAHFGQSEGRTEAAATTASERDPDVRVWARADEAFRPELQRIGIEHGGSHHEVDGRVDERACRQPQLS